MNRPMLYVDFNEMLAFDLFLLSKGGQTIDSNGEPVMLHEGMAITVYSDDLDENNNVDNLIASGTAERNTDTGWSKHVQWCVRIDSNGIRHQSGGCKKFCVNGQLAGKCLYKGNNDHQKTQQTGQARS